MDAVKAIYNKQKGIKGYFDLKKYSTIISIAQITRAGAKFIIKDKDGTEYVHFLKFQNRGWEENLKVGNNVRVFVIERKVKNKIYLNVYPDHFSHQIIVPDKEL